MSQSYYITIFWNKSYHLLMEENLIYQNNIVIIIIDTMSKKTTYRIGTLLQKRKKRKEKAKCETFSHSNGRERLCQKLGPWSRTELNSWYCNFRPITSFCLLFFFFLVEKRDYILEKCILFSNDFKFCFNETIFSSCVGL